MYFTCYYAKQTKHTVKTYMLDFARHGVCARGPAGVVEDNDAVRDDECSDGHDED